jgi:putative toxin-antitoxin system antitoxin component (TIGR02293 family)
MPRHAFKAPAQRTAASSIQRAARALGLRRVPANELELADMAREGFPSTTLSRLSSSLGWTRAALIEQLGIAPRTASRRLTRREPLSTTESERVLRLARVLARAVEVFESQDAAKEWLQGASAALGERKPIDLLATDIGTEVVLNELGKIDHGFFA